MNDEQIKHMVEGLPAVRKHGTHIHTLVPKEKPVLLHRYQAEDGKMTMVDTTARDTLKQFVCSKPGCNYEETYDLERMVV